MRRSKIITSLGWIALALYICVKSFDLGLGNFSAPGPGFMPFLSGIIMCILGSVILWIEWKDKQYIQQWGTINFVKIIIILLGIVTYAFLLQRLGFLLINFIVLAIFFKVIGEYKWKNASLYSLLATLVVYIIFEIWLKSGFPKGILGI